MYYDDETTPSLASHTEQKLLVKEKKSKAITDDETCREQFENSDRRGVPSDHDADPHICIVAF